MNHMQRSIFFSLILAVVVAPCFAEGVIRPGTIIVKSTSTELSGTPGYSMALDFLAERYDAGQNPIDVRLMLGELGPITVKKSKTIAAPWASAGVRAPPDPGDVPTDPTGGPDEPGNPGDHQSYDTCNGTIQFIWSYEYKCGDDGCNWVMTDFEMHSNDPDCGGSP